jgi:cation diffusion facilitator CzcD-associated flavoprotein CzcO
MVQTTGMICRLFFYTSLTLGYCIVTMQTYFAFDHVITHLSHPDDGPQTCTIVIGAGPAGLAVGARLKHAGISCLILEMYALKFQLEFRFGQRVAAARHIKGFWEVQTQDACYQALNLVIATGFNREPYLPTWPGQISFKGALLHSSQYRNGEPFKNQKVLVVGFGNSGGEIAIDLGSTVHNLAWPSAAR